MNSSRFNEIVREELNNIENILIKKQAEYNPDEDKLRNFKRGAEIIGTSPEKVLYGYMTKHLISQSDMISSDKKYTREMWLEKLNDIINYNILLLALLEDDKLFKEE